MIYFGSVILEKIFKWPNPTFAFFWLFPFWREPDSLFERFRIPFTQGWFVPSLIEIGLLVLEKVFKNVQCSFTLLLLSPLGQGPSTSFKQFRIPSPNDDLRQVWLNWPSGSGEEVENVKKKFTDRRTTDNGQSVKLTWDFSSGEL
jgi:hypothetical protein